MRKRLVFALAVLVMTLAAIPFGASAAAPNMARISATSYQDMLGREFNALCQDERLVALAPGASVQTTVTISGSGPDLGGTGTGSLELSFYGSSFDIYGILVINGQEMVIKGGGQMFCLLPDYAIVSGSFGIRGGESSMDDTGVFGTLTGTISDGVHQNQGRVSLMLSESDDVKR